MYKVDIYGVEDSELLYSTQDLAFRFAMTQFDCDIALKNGGALVDDDDVQIGSITEVR